MCAINGIAGNGIDAELVGAMNVATVHRGPDGTRTLALPGVTLGFNRLAVVDLDERAMQPMQTPDGRYTLIFNGEIYNFKELRGQLADAYDFKTESDTEVVLAAYARCIAASDPEDPFDRVFLHGSVLGCDRPRSLIGCLVGSG